MAKPKVFLSSTCYDLSTVRSELRPFVESLGYEPVMSDFSDVLFDPRQHTHDSCVKELGSSDLLILIIGSRFGGTALPTASSFIDFEAIVSHSTRDFIKEFKDELSITQIEVLKAIQEAIPIYAFVQSDVYRDHLVYEKNKHNQDVVKKIQYPSIQKQDTAIYIFEFINFLSHRSSNNSIYSFTSIEDIRSQLRSQWAHLFQRLLQEGILRAREVRQYRAVSEQIEDLKAVILTSIGNEQLRDTAKGVLRYRMLVDFVYNLRVERKRERLIEGGDWDTLLSEAGVIETVESIEDRDPRPGTLLIREDRTFYRFRGSPNMLARIRDDWYEFHAVEEGARKAIFEALVEAHEGRPSMLLRYIDLPVEEYLDRFRRDAIGEAEPQ